MKPLKVLSIDFDYFVDCESYEKDEFPDPNENISLGTNTRLWISRYAEQRKNVDRFGRETERLLTEIPVNMKTFKHVEKLLKKYKLGALNNDSNKPMIVVTNSHSVIYPAIFNLLKREQPVKLLNLDDHSDFYNIGKELNCGNWGNKLLDTLTSYGVLEESEVHWVTKPKSLSLIERSEICDKYQDFLSISSPNVEDSLENYILGFFNKEVPDLIFMCRSSCWVPPHLDFKFLELVRILQDYKVPKSVFENCVMKPRYTSKFKKSVNILYNQMCDIVF